MTAGPSQAAAVVGAKAKAASLEEVAQDHAWLPSLLLFLASGIAWTASIPLLFVTVGGSIQPHVGWPWGVAIAVVLFSILVQVDQRIATGVVFLVSFSSAAVAGSRQALVFSAAATGLTMLNGIKHLCSGCPELLEFQCKGYARYHKSCQLSGALDSIQPGRSFFACHPHGCTSVGWISNVVWNRRFHHAAGRCFYLIDSTLRNKGLLARLFCDAFEGPHGGFRDNSQGTIKQLMARGESVCMIPGAYQEATLFTYGRDRVALNKRRGFVKYCLRHGYRLHPVYTFGESETYWALGGFESFRLWLNNYGIPTVAFWGLWWCPILPRRHCELMTFVGQPLELPCIENPTDEEVELWHGKYMKCLQVLFDQHKAEAGLPSAKLEIV
mmetsp:Transcript_8318/g.22955  ORF Transcript_8318/g.22955 Transcript_8318/m.22955 type:complete len:384 (-) Transcript_8318:43-1194(-)